MHILAGTDGSDSANRAIDFAAKLAHDSDGSLTILHVISSQVAPELHELARQEHVPIGELLASLADRTLEQAARRARDCGINPKLISQTGDVPSWLLSCAEQDLCDVIVVGKRGRGRLEGLLLGSVSQSVVSHCRCAVIVVP